MAINSASSQVDIDSAFDVSNLTLGFLGCGKISSALVKGYASCNPRKIIVSRRNEEKSRILAEAFPDLVTVLDDNAELVRNSDIIFIGLLPGVAREILPTLPFRPEGQIIVSMMAAVDYDELTSKLLPSLTSPQYSLVRTVPLPSAARRCGPILQYPRNSNIANLLRLVGTPVECENEAQMKPMVSITGHISSFYELLRTTQDFLIDSGVDASLSKQFVTSFYCSLASGAQNADTHTTFAEMRDEAATPGGLNEQSLRFLTGSPHFELQNESLQAILARLRGTATATKK